MLKKILVSLVILWTFGNSFAMEISKEKKLENKQAKQIQNKYSKTFEKIIDKFLEKKDSKQLEELDKKLNKINYKNFSLKLRLFIKTLSYKITKKIEEKRKIITEKIAKKWSFVKVHYIWKTKNDWKEFDNSYKRWATLNFVAGDGQMIKGFDEGVIWMKTWEKKTIEIAPKDAYWKRNPEKKQTINKKELTDFVKNWIKLEVWNELPTGMWKFKIIAVDKDFITIDTNHPLAWKTLIFEVEMVEIIQNYREKLRQEKEKLIKKQKKIDIEKKSKKIVGNPNLTEWLEFIFITDKNEKITKELDLIKTISRQVTTTFELKWAKYTNLDFSEKIAKKILDDNKIKEIPILLVNNNKWEKDKPANAYLKKINNNLFIVQPGFYNPKTKKYSSELGSLCSNGIDDNKNGRKDCEEETCLQSNPKNVCETEIKKLEKEYKIKQDEVQKKADKTQNDKLKKIKSDKPKVDLYVMSYCPYWTQAEKAVLGLLDSKYIDFNIKFVHYLMHWEKEGKENLLQYCIQKEEKEKFSKYLWCFLEAWNSKDCLEKNKIDMKKIKKCEIETDKKYDITKNINTNTKRFADFNIDRIEGQKAWIQGSPTLVINGLKIDLVKRSERWFAEIICKTFKKAPKICEDLNKFSDKVYSPWFGFKNWNAKIQGGCEN